MTTTVLIYCPSEERLLRKKLRALVWDEALPRRILRQLLYGQKWFPKLPDVLARDGKHGQKSWDAPRLPHWLEMVWEIFQMGRNGLGGFQMATLEARGGFPDVRRSSRKHQRPQWARQGASIVLMMLLYVAERDFAEFEGHGRSNESEIQRFAAYSSISSAIGQTARLARAARSSTIWYTETWIRLVIT